PELGPNAARRVCALVGGGALVYVVKSQVLVVDERCHRRLPIASLSKYIEFCLSSGGCFNAKYKRSNPLAGGDLKSRDGAVHTTEIVVIPAHVWAAVRHQQDEAPPWAFISQEAFRGLLNCERSRCFTL